MSVSCKKMAFINIFPTSFNKITQRHIWSAVHQLHRPQQQLRVTVVHSLSVCVAGWRNIVVRTGCSIKARRRLISLALPAAVAALLLHYTPPTTHLPAWDTKLTTHPPKKRMQLPSIRFFVFSSERFLIQFLCLCLLQIQPPYHK